MWFAVYQLNLYLSWSIVKFPLPTDFQGTLLKGSFFVQIKLDAKLCAWRVQLNSHIRQAINKNFDFFIGINQNLNSEWRGGMLVHHNLMWKVFRDEEHEPTASSINVFLLILKFSFQHPTTTSAIPVTWHSSPESRKKLPSLLGKPQLPGVSRARRVWEEDL